MPPLLAAALIAALAQPPDAKPALEGTARNALTSQPIANVWIRLSNERSPTGTHELFTDDKGRFQIDNLEPGTYRFTAKKPSFFGDAAGTPELLKVLRWPPTAPGPIEFRLFPQSVITGRILDDRGEPAQGATVRAIEVRNHEGHNVYQLRATAQADDLGKFRLGWLIDGPHVLLISYEEYWLQERYGTPFPSRKITSRYVPLFSPGVILPAHAESFNLRLGQELTVPDFTIRKQRVHGVRGRILGLEPGECESATVSIHPQDPFLEAQGIFSYGASCQRDGEFEFTGMPAGAYELAARLNASPQRTLAGATKVVLGQADLEGIQITLAPPQELSGKLILEGSKMGPPIWANVSVYLERPSDESRPDETAAAPDGSFQLKYALPSRYLLKAREAPTRDSYPASVLVGEQEYLRKPIDLTAGQPGPVRIIYRADLGQLRSSLRPFESSVFDEIIHLVMFPADRARRTLRSLWQPEFDTAGVAHCYGIPPGDYLVLALPLSLANSIFREKGLTPEMEKAATRVHIDPHGNHEVQLKLYRPPQ